MGECQGRVPGPSYGLSGLTGYEKHDFTKNRAPAFSLGLKTKQPGGSLTPGPYNIGQVDRFGKYPYLGWTMESKAGPSDKKIGPSPLSYAPEKMKVYTPAYSFGLSAGGKRPPFGPSPADYYYQYPQIPGYTLYDLLGHPYKDLNKIVSCGPKAAVPTDLFKPRAPAYSLGLKGKPLCPNGVGPGPKYLPKKLCVCQGYSFGMRHHKCAPPLITYEDNN